MSRSSRPVPARSRIRPMLAAAVLSLLTSWLLGMAGPANATDYRFWSFWSGDGGKWTPIEVGPADYKLKDKSVFGAKFVVGSDKLQPSNSPTRKPDYQELCPKSSGGTGIHVAFLIDFGSPAEAPPGETPPASKVECVTLPDSATGAAALNATSSVRMGESGLVCGIDGYPKVECAVSVSEASATATATTPSALPTATPATTAPAVPASSSQSGWWLAAGVVVVIVILAALAFLRGRSKNTDNDSDQ